MPECHALSSLWSRFLCFITCPPSTGLIFDARTQLVSAAMRDAGAGLHVGRALAVVVAVLLIVSVQLSTGGTKRQRPSTTRAPDASEPVTATAVPSATADPWPWRATSAAALLNVLHHGSTVAVECLPETPLPLCASVTRVLSANGSLKVGLATRAGSSFAENRELVRRIRDANDGGIPLRPVTSANAVVILADVFDNASSSPDFVGAVNRLVIQRAVGRGASSVVLFGHTAQLSSSDLLVAALANRTVSDDTYDVTFAVSLQPMPSVPSRREFALCGKLTRRPPTPPDVLGLIRRRVGKRHPDDEPVPEESTKWRIVVSPSHVAAAARRCRPDETGPLRVHVLAFDNERSLDYDRLPDTILAPALSAVGVSAHDVRIEHRSLPPSPPRGATFEVPLTPSAQDMRDARQEPTLEFNWTMLQESPQSSLAWSAPGKCKGGTPASAPRAVIAYWPAAARPGANESHWRLPRVGPGDAVVLRTGGGGGSKALVANDCLLLRRLIVAYRPAILLDAMREVTLSMNYDPKHPDKTVREACISRAAASVPLVLQQYGWEYMVNRRRSLGLLHDLTSLLGPRPPNVLNVPIGGSAVSSRRPTQCDLAARPSMKVAALGGAVHVRTAHNVSVLRASRRPFDWAFAGGNKDWCCGSSDPNQNFDAFKGRRDIIRNLSAELPNGISHLSDAMFGGDTLKADSSFFGLLTRAKFVPLLRGWIALETYRGWEALDAGAIPVMVGRLEEIRNTFGFFPGPSYLPPWVIAPTWSEAIGQMKLLMANATALDELQVENQRWLRRLLDSTASVVRTALAKAWNRTCAPDWAAALPPLPVAP